MEKKQGGGKTMTLYLIFGAANINKQSMKGWFRN
jgi:hypothetical protein